MAAETFPHALRLVLVDEGGLDDDPHDHGGRTAHGIIQREFDGYCQRHNTPRRDVWTITPAEYTAIYHDRYWMPWCDRLPAGLDYAFFDACVNAGPAQAARTLQRVLGKRTDGNMGDVTLAAAQVSDVATLIHAFCAARRQFYRSLAQFPRYGRGWLSRVDHVERAAKAMVVAGAETTTRNGLDDETKAQASARSRPEDTAKPPVSPEVSGSVAVGGGVFSSVIGKLQEMAGQLAPVQEALSGVQWIVVGISLLAAAFAIYAIIHEVRIKRATA